MFDSTHTSHLSAAQEYAAELLGATGLNRFQLARVLRQIGLFGHESTLTAAERKAVLAAIGPLPGFAPAPPPPAANDSVHDLYAFACELVEDPSGEALAAPADEDASHSEARRVVGNVLAAFGPPQARAA